MLTFLLWLFLKEAAAKGGGKKGKKEKQPKAEKSGFPTEVSFSLEHIEA